MRQFMGALALFALIGCAAAQADDYEALASRLDPDHPGRGPDQYTSEVLDHAMAYALVASADAAWHARTGSEAALNRAVTAAEWLVDNRDADGDGLVGWGLSFDWDAFSDGTTNPIGWPYTITTAVAIQGLLDVHEVTGDEVLVDVALEAVRVMVSEALERYEGGAWFWYSPAPHDALDTHNVSAVMLGQLQRLSTFDPTLGLVADDVAAHLLAASRWSDGGRIYWMYAAPGVPGANRENDLVHAAYIVQGLADYVRFGGRVDVDVEALYWSLAAFVSGQRVTEFPGGQAAARGWGVGAALYAAAVLEDMGVEGGLSRRFYRAAASYDPEVLYPRQAAHVLLGLAITSPAPR